jgi:hypothetical protein
MKPRSSDHHVSKLQTVLHLARKSISKISNEKEGQKVKVRKNKAIPVTGPV